MATSKKRSKKPGKTQEKAVVSQVVEETPEDSAESQEELQRDILDDFLFHAANYIYIRRKLFISLAVIIVAVILASYGTFRFLQYRANQRNVKLYAIEKIIHDDSLSSDQQFQKALPLLNQFLESHGDTEQSVLALLHRGSLYYSQKQYAEADADFQQIRSTLDKNSELYILASIYLANALQDQNKLDEAIDILKSAQSDKMMEVVLMELAEMYVKTEKTKEAKETLNILLADFPKGPYSTKAREMLDQL